MVGSERLEVLGSQTNATGGNNTREVQRGNNSTTPDRRQADESRNNQNYTYGDELDMNRNPYDDSLLCLSLNLNGLKQEQWKVKNEQLRKYLKNYEFDIMGFQEVNLNWGKVGPKDQ